MVARINTGKDVSKALNYNEQKVSAGTAETLNASGFLKEAANMNFYEKLNGFKRLTSLNERTVTNTLHVSLNFDPGEKLCNEKLTSVAEAYMEKIGFKDQPFLVYRHYDAGHPHIHIVSVNIRSDGSRISMHNMGRNQSEKARKEIEIEFGLVKADAKRIKESEKIRAVDASKVIYGKSETRLGIANVLGVVLTQYKFSSIHELNAVLRLYNITADRGEEGSRLREKAGLVFRVLDEQGNKVGVPIKASALPLKPTLKNLQILFDKNKPLKEKYKNSIKEKIRAALGKMPSSLKEFIRLLEKDGISSNLHKGKEDNIYGITFIDRESKTVFNGSDLGREFSYNNIRQHCEGKTAGNSKKEAKSKTQKTKTKSKYKVKKPKPDKKTKYKISDFDFSILPQLKPTRIGHARDDRVVAVESSDTHIAGHVMDYIPAAMFEIRKKQKKKSRKL